MTNNLHYIIREGKNQLKYWETEEPKCNGKPYCCEGKRCEWLQWKDLAKYKYVDIKPEFVEEIKNAAWFELETNDWQEFEKLAEKGIPLPESISKRVVIELKCDGWCSGCKAFDWSVCKDKYHATLTPIEPQAEEQNEAVLFGDWLLENYYRKDASRLFSKEKRYCWISVEEARKSWNDEKRNRYTTQELFNQFKLKNK